MIPPAVDERMDKAISGEMSRMFPARRLRVCSMRRSLDLIGKDFYK